MSIKLTNAIVYTATKAIAAQTASLKFRLQVSETRRR